MPEKMIAIYKMTASELERARSRRKASRRSLIGCFECSKIEYDKLMGNNREVILDRLYAQEALGALRDHLDCCIVEKSETDWDMHPMPDRLRMDGHIRDLRRAISKLGTILTELDDDQLLICKEKDIDEYKKECTQKLQKLIQARRCNLDESASCDETRH